jgi:ATP-dependent protease ClpP protease subunit
MLVNQFGKRSLKSTKSAIYLSKKIKIADTNNNIMIAEEEEEEENPLKSLIPKDDNAIYREGNHIYFRSDITTESITKLIKLINEINNEFKQMCADLINCKIIPKPTYLHITSDGGIVYAGLMGMDAIENSLIPIYTVVSGSVASSGTLLSLAGKKRYMTKNAYMLIHQISSGASGNFEQLTDCYTNNKELMDHIKEIYEKKSNGKLKGKKLELALKHDLYWNFDICKSNGLVDEIYKTDQLFIVE